MGGFSSEFHGRKIKKINLLFKSSVHKWWGDENKHEKPIHFLRSVFGHEVARERSVWAKNRCKRLKMTLRVFLWWFWHFLFFAIFRQNRFLVTKWVGNGPFELRIGANGSKWRRASFYGGFNSFWKKYFFTKILKNQDVGFKNQIWEFKHWFS